MEWTSLNDLREKFLSFYESKGHLRLKSFSLIPHNDNSLLLINSGMAPMKKYFTGEVTPPRKRVTTCQKCIRTPDIERVGKTARHGTYFEMLGNFSFGDYFKHEATAWAWEFCTVVLKMPKDRLWISIYENDDEAFDIWTKEVGVDPSHIVRLGKEDNFWEHGSGPCGPCSEIYFDRGEKYGCGSPTCGVGCDCDRYVEFWNLVFTQFDSDGNGNYAPLDHPNIDTGMGLERLACIFQEVDNLFEVDTVRNIMKALSDIAGIKYHDNPKADVSLRVITDHIRSTCFMIGDGVMPDNEGRGYVLRRLLRRAARHGRLLGINRPFLYQLVDTVIHENESAYPELKEKRELITKLIRVEEESFGRTIDQGLQLLDSYTADTGDCLSGERAFKLYDTYGFPLDLTKDILEERGIGVDEDGFTRLMAEQRQRARDARKAADSEAWKGDGAMFASVPPTEFLGYDRNFCEAKIISVVSADGGVSALEQGQSGAVVLDKTAFYAESGGQVADTGVIKTGSCLFKVTSVSKTAAGVFVHSGSVESGVLAVGDVVSAEIDVDRRERIRRNHTGAHLLQAALRRVLGSHVEQAGQLVNDKTLRFDFTHFSALSAEELTEVEDIINREILSGVEVVSREMPIEEARKLGAMALFGEKYGDVVRVVSAGDYSIEFCGGTHTDNTAKLGLFRIVSEGSVAAGVRRIEAVTGLGVIESIRTDRRVLSEAAAALKSGSVDDVAVRAKQIAAELKEKLAEIAKLEGELAAGQIDSIRNSAKNVRGFAFMLARVDDTDSDTLKLMGDRLRDDGRAIAVIASVSGEKLTFMCCCGGEAVKAGAHAGNIVREIAKLTGGNGGGKPELAMAGGKDISKLDDALGAAVGIVEKFVRE